LNNDHDSAQCRSNSGAGVGADVDCFDHRPNRHDDRLSAAVVDRVVLIGVEEAVDDAGELPLRARAAALSGDRNPREAECTDPSDIRQYDR
jgi:hypothetical protein